MIDIETHIENVRASVETELAKQPFRVEPTWADLHAAIAAVVRYFVGAGACVPAVSPMAVDADAVAPVAAEAPTDAAAEAPADASAAAVPPPASIYQDDPKAVVEPPPAANDETPPPPSAA